MTTVKRLFLCCFFIGISIFSFSQSSYATDNLLVRPGNAPTAVVAGIQTDYGMGIADVFQLGIAEVELWHVNLPIVYYAEGQQYYLNNILDVLTDVQQRLQGNTGSDAGLNYNVENPLPFWQSTFGFSVYDPLPYCNEDFTIPAGSNFVKVGIIDSGMDFNLFYSSPRVAAGSHFNFPLNDPRNIFDADGHGTLVTGIIDKMLEASGVNNATISMFQIGDESGVMYLSDMISAVERAISQDIDILQIALGYTPHPLDESIFLHEVLGLAASNQILTIIAAGNEGQVTDEEDYYPSAFEMHGALKVASSNCNNELALFSNYGFGSITLAAPGTAVLGPKIGGNYYLSDGTSQSSAIITSCAASLFTHIPNPSSVYCAIVSTVEPVPSLATKVNSGGIFYDLNIAYNALMQDPGFCGPGFSLDQEAPPQIDLAEQSFEPGIHISPNPFSDVLTLKVKVDKPTAGTLKFIGITGQLVDEVDLHLEAGSNNLAYTPPTNQLMPGTYFILLQTAHQTFQQKIVFSGR